MKKYNKLVRDKIPEIIRAKGKPYKTHIAEDKEYWNKLKEKLREETEEFIRTEDEKEMADIFQVIDAIFEYLGLKKKYIRFVQREKAKEKGKFKKRIILEKS